VPAKQRYTSPPGPAAKGTRRPGVRLVVAGVVLTVVAAMLVAAAVRPPAPAGEPAARPSLMPPRPPLTPEEEAYARALWPIHNEVKASALRVTMGGISYKLGEIDRAALKGRLDAAREIYRAAEARMAGLRPPPSFERVHADYLRAVRLYEESVGEMLRVVADGREEHLVAAFPMSREAGTTLLKVGNVLWPGEYVPN